MGAASSDEDVDRRLVSVEVSRDSPPSSSAVVGPERIDWRNEPGGAGVAGNEARGKRRLSNARREGETPMIGWVSASWWRGRASVCCNGGSRATLSGEGEVAAGVGSLAPFAKVGAPVVGLTESEG